MILCPNVADPALTSKISGCDQSGNNVELAVVAERALTIFLNSQEILTVMTIGDYPDYLAVGFLKNQGILRDSDKIIAIDYDSDIETVVVRTEGETLYEKKQQKKIRTSGCAMGTVFGDIYEKFEHVCLPKTKIKTSWLYALSREIPKIPSLYLSAGAIHGTVLCMKEKPLVYFEDVGRHNAVDKVAGWMRSENILGGDKILYTTGRLTSEMVIKTVMMGIPALVSRSGFTAWAVELARKAGLTLIGRMRGERFVCLAAQETLYYDCKARFDKNTLSVKNNDQK